MTTRQKIEALLHEKGLFESQATKVMNYAIPLIDEEMQKEGASKITWDRPCTEYPNALYAVLFMSHIKKHVLAWANENMPQAWWRPQFE